jgi:hypothetical protein
MTTNLLPLYSFFEALDFHPFHGFGIAGTGDTAVSNSCNSLVRRHAWQNSDAVGHKAIMGAIAHAETMLREYLGFSVAPHYVVETLPWPRLADVALVRWGAADVDGRRLSVKLEEGEIRAIGVETLAAIQTSAAVTYTDADGDGVEDTFTISAPTSVTDASQIAVYISAADRYNGWGRTTDLSNDWRLLPLKVTISGGTVTIRGPKQLCVKPIKYEGAVNVGANGLEPNTATNFVTTLDIYQRYTATDSTAVATSQAVIAWETMPGAGCCGSSDVSSAYSGSPYDPAAVAQAVARVGIRDARTGLVTPAEAAYNTTTGVWSDLDWTLCQEPDRVTVRYLAGFPLSSDGQMQQPFRTIVARLAAAELTRPICGCVSANQELDYWQFDLARTAGANDEQYGTTTEILNCPFGSRRGQVWAWKQVQHLRQLRGFAAG